jgi:curved DNA-binding protein
VLRSPEKRAAYDQLGSGPRRRPGVSPAAGLGRRIRVQRRGPGAALRGITATSSNHCSGAQGGARAVGGVSTRGQRGPSRQGACWIWRHRSTADREASRCASRRSMTRHLTLKERVLNVKVPKGILPGQTIRLAGQGRAFLGARMYCGRSLHRSRISAASTLSRSTAAICISICPWRRGKPRSAPASRRRRRAVRRLKIPSGSHAGDEAAAQGPWDIPASPPGDLYVVLQIALPPADRRSGQGGVPGHGRGDAVQSAHAIWECRTCRTPKNPCCPGKYSRNTPS